MIITFNIIIVDTVDWMQSKYFTTAKEFTNLTTKSFYGNTIIICTIDIVGIDRGESF